jgi:hypothetical protein
MGKQLLITHNNQLISGKELFITDENSIYRKAKKAFLTVDGVHKLVYALEEGVKWTKYNCNIETEYTFVQVSTRPYSATIGDTMSMTCTNRDAASQYYWDRTEGFTVGNDVYINTSSESSAAKGIGYYIGRVYINSGSYSKVKEVWQIISLDSYYQETTETGRIVGHATYTIKAVALCEIESSTDYYKPGKTSYGTIIASEGSLPEEGTLIDGSATDAYCVLLIDTIYYYYVKQI